MKTRTILIHGPRGCGKTQAAEILRAHYNCSGVIDEWTGEYRYGYLHLTSRPPQEFTLVKGVEYISFADAMKEMLDANR